MINSEINDNSNSNDNSPQSSNQISSKLVAIIRIRPINQQEEAFSNIDIIKIPKDNLINLIYPTEFDQTEKGTYYIQALKNVEIVQSKEYQYCFDKIYSEGASQEEVYSFTSNLLRNVLNGYNSTVMAYGATGTGKTYTIVGTGHQPGIMTRAISDLFMLLYTQTTNKSSTVELAYVELYNEFLTDLLSEQGSLVDIRSDPNSGLMFSGFASREVKNVSEAMKLLLKGNNKRREASTDANDRSSRSHGILQVTVNIINPIDNLSSLSKLLLLDLAGNEKVLTASALKKEGTSINKSLLALAKCINVLISPKGNSFISWRDSKLTQILRESLNGNAAITMIGTISSNIVEVDETMSTLQFVNKARQIRLKQRKTERESPVVFKYEKTIEELRRDIAVLKAKIAEKAFVFDNTPDFPINQIEFCPELDKQFALIKKHFDQEVLLKKDIINKEKEIADLKFGITLIKAFAVKGEKNLKKQMEKIEDNTKKLKVCSIQLEALYKAQSDLLVKRKEFQQLIEVVSNENTYEDSDATVKERVMRQYRQSFMNVYNFYLAQMKNMTLESSNQLSEHDDKIKDNTIALLMEQLYVRDHEIQKSHMDIFSVKGAVSQQEAYESYHEMKLNPCRLPLIPSGVITLKKIGDEVKGDEEAQEKEMSLGKRLMLPCRSKSKFKAKYYPGNYELKRRMPVQRQLNYSGSASNVLLNKDIFINNKLVLKHAPSLQKEDSNTKGIESKLKSKVKTIFRRDILGRYNNSPYRVNNPST